ncbi:hypothetical protein KIL84_002771 [Mauremys mutica]|uniref:Uncharacterized protein n=1 Tax=Mauremys mutica TaxID=74926 RepID=A0A9D3WTX7_9SAUR|nr:hypothetical protein KIL84_002771 [Mauremys mutica]
MLPTVPGNLSPSLPPQDSSFPSKDLMLLWYNNRCPSAQVMGTPCFPLPKKRVAVELVLSGEQQVAGASPTECTQPVLSAPRCHGDRLDEAGQTDELEVTLQTLWEANTNSHPCLQCQT